MQEQLNKIKCDRCSGTGKYSLGMMERSCEVCEGHGSRYQIKSEIALDADIQRSTTAEIKEILALKSDIKGTLPIVAEKPKKRGRPKR